MRYKGSEQKFKSFNKPLKTSNKYFILSKQPIKHQKRGIKNANKQREASIKKYRNFKAN